MANLYSSLALILSVLMMLLCLGEPIKRQRWCKSLLISLSLSSSGFQKVLSVFGIIRGTEKASADFKALMIWLQ